MIHELEPSRTITIIAEGFGEKLNRMLIYKSQHSAAIGIT